MARTEVPQSKFIGNGNLADPAGTAVNPGAGNGHYIAAAPSDRMVLRVTNTHGSAHPVVVKAGAYPPAIAAGQGDLSVSVAATTGVQWIGPLESGRFIQADGRIHVDIETAHAGTITAFVLPKAV
ncbi:hypothetical protein [Kibdelosporangium phytohabitans]|uniref:Uncharacterized protein n=1 Tax=Kibdelosporangium phytohabitans TaxID=860235 RepID=A0A0N9HVW2_9PSEU|nr:hypothetical protein [Kibdelosporangium phytohabitans]ALG07660.1 hypothetical protein AOZ06_12755 [Kibdelosporangium phytohabitans]ALG07716.1 hypothetical protein AOZ06_13075 [Kibdelosporangium phytohabitans]MBE1471380.1 hypothetical protein [Kibdelosporangium phytohabitans]